MPNNKEKIPPRLGRRAMFKLFGGATLATGVSLTIGEINAAINARRPRILGFTFSSSYCETLDLPIVKTFEHLLDRLEPDAVRLGTYWNKTEPKPGKFNFSLLESQLNAMSKRRNPPRAVVTIGMKAPRWPEFYFPAWISNDSDINTSRTDVPLDSNHKLADAATNFVSRTAEFLKDFSIVDYRQYENEPFNANDVSLKRYVGEKYVRNLITEGEKAAGENSGKTLLTYGLSPLLLDEANQLIVTTSRMADSAGQNVYIDAPGYLPGAANAILRTASLQKTFLSLNGVEDWVTECQAEPWDKGGVFPLRTEYTSATPETGYNLARYLGGRGHQRVLIWGPEFWIKQEEIGNPAWMQKGEKLFSGY